MIKDYVSKNSLAEFLAKIRENFSAKDHIHTKSDIADYVEVTVDTEMSSDSTNPVQNKIIKEKFDSISDQVSALANDAILSVEQHLSEDQKAQARANIGAQQILTFDAEPTSESTNPVTSGGLFSKFTTQDENIEMASMTANMAMPGSLKWDGIVGSRERVVVSEEQVDESTISRQQLVHVSDYVPETFSLMIEMAQAEGGILPALCSMSGMICGGMHESHEVQAQVADDMFIMGQEFVYVPTDGYSMEGVAFPKKGWYFMSVTYCIDDIEIPMAYVSGLKLEMVTFPDTNGGGDADKYFESVEEEVYRLSWNTNEITETFRIGMLQIGKISSDIPDVSVFSNGYKFICDGESFEITKNMTGEYIAKNDGEDYILCVPGKNSDGNIFPFPYMFVVPYDGFNLDGIIIPNAGVYTIAGSSNNVCALIVNEPRSVIKTEHLPKALQFGEITKTGRINELTWDGDTTGLVSVEIPGSSIMLYKISDDIPKTSDFVPGVILDMVSSASGTITDDIPYNELSQYVKPDGLVVSEAFMVVPHDNYTYNTGSVNVTFPESGVYFVRIGETYTSRLYFNVGFPVTTTETVKIDPKYLPDGFGGEGGDGLPEVSTEDNGKFLRVVNGAPAWASIPNAEEATF